MGAIDYPKEFVERTLKLVRTTSEYIKNKQGLEVTFLMNCLLGLIVTVAENEKSKRFFEGKVDAEFAAKIPEKVWYLHIDKNTENSQEEDSDKPYLINKIPNFVVKSKDDLASTTYSKHQFLKKLRNAIAHQNVMPKNQNGEWVGVRMWNKNDFVDFEIIFTIDELRDFATYIANIYIKANKTTA